MADKIMADVVESFIAALYLDKGIEYAQTFCRVCLFPKLSVSTFLIFISYVCHVQESAEGLQFLDAKTRLQHAIVYTCKKQGLDITVPVYRNLSVGGPVNKQIFTGKKYLILNFNGFMFQLVYISEEKDWQLEQDQGN